ncbi:MAG TPA: ATP-binding protein [Candidatus Acidoferrales bacterium]|nr:ATP-binding protein [Candidatus Acidoferrales bacterium]
MNALLLQPYDPSSGSSSGRTQLGGSASPGDQAFAAVFDSSAEALLVIEQGGAIVRANRRAAELLRLRDAAVRDSNLRDFVSGQPEIPSLEDWVQNTFAAFPPTLDSSLANGFPVRITLRAILPGEDLLLCIEEGPMVQRAEAKSNQVEAELRTLLDSAREGAVLFDREGRVRFAGAAFGQMFGIEARALQGLDHFEDVNEMLSPRFRDPASFSARWESFLSGEAAPAHDELEMVRPVRRVVERYCRPVLGAHSQPIGWLELFSDVTGERQIQSEMLQTEKMAALGQLVSGIAHELNNPLTAIMGYAQLLLGHKLPPPRAGEAKKVYQEAERARRIVKNLLYFAHGNTPERTRVDLNEIVERTLALRAYELKVEDIVVECDLAPNLPETMADPFQLQQVVLNLLVNAEQALLEGRGKGNIWIRTRAADSGKQISLAISDDGPGIPPEIAFRIFDPFFTTKPPGVGTGLGLSIVYGIVQQHGGDVTVENRHGFGARFIVDLPVTPVTAPAAPAEQPPRDAARAALAGRILVVEDEPTVAQLIGDILREEDHEVEAVLDSQEGLARLSRASYDLVVCDLRMPRLDGPAFYDALVRSGSPLKDRIVFVTGDTLAPRTLAFLRQNKLPYLAKPFLIEELKLAVHKALGDEESPGHEHTRRRQRGA